jgi:hypothetical protein
MLWSAFKPIVRQIAIVTLLAAVTLTALVALAWWLWPPHYYAQSRLSLEVRTTHYFPRFSRDEYGFMAQFLSSPDGRRALAVESAIDEREFAVTEVCGVRNTQLFCITCSSTDGGRVQRLADNAAKMIVSHYQANQPSWQINYIDSYSFNPSGPFRRAWDQIEADFRDATRH